MTDLEQALAAGGKPVQSDYEAALAGGATVPQEQAEPGRAEAFGRGALQGVTLGFGDEIQGALESIFTDKTYQQARDQARQANARAQQAHGGFYGAGEVGGGIGSAFIPGLGIAEGAGLGTVAAKSALAGGLSGLGGSEATDVEGLAKDVGEGTALGAAGGAVAHGLGTVASKVLGGAEEKSTQQAVKGLVAGEGKPLLEAKKAEIGTGLDEIYDRADKTSGGVKVSDLVKHYDDQIAELSKSPGNRGAIKALEDTRDDALKSWAPKLAAALDSEEASVPAVRQAILGQLDVKVPSKDVRSFASTLQERGSTNKQIRQQLGSTTRDFVNGHVGNVLGDADRSALEGLNARMSAAYTVERALEDRAAKEAGGKVSQSGALSNLLHGGGVVAAGMSALHGNILGAVAALALPKAIEAAPRLGRFATTQAAKANQILERIAEAAKQGNPWAAQQIRALRQTPLGAARLASLAPTVAAPVDQQSQQEAQ